jgi:predicted transport protein
MNPTWKCPRCKRSFRQVNQRHSCGVGNRKLLLQNKPAALVDLYHSLEKTLRSYEGVEIVTRDRYALFRTTRIFADLVFMRDALRLAVHLKEEVSHPLFFKVGRGENDRVAHVAKIHDIAELAAIEPYLREAYNFAQSESA